MNKDFLSDAKRIVEDTSTRYQNNPQCDELMKALGDMIHGHEALVKRINTPKIDVFLEAVELEALHQKSRWDDSNKRDADWLALVVYLAQKAHFNADPGMYPHDKKLHRIITIAAAASHWHAATRG